MPLLKPSCRTTTHLLQHKAPRLHNTSSFHCACSRQYVTEGQPRPRSYNDTNKSRPLVGTNKPDQAPPPGSIPNPVARSSSIPRSQPKYGGVAYPYIRISIGLVLCGSIVYSMVFQLPQNSSHKLTYMHASSPLPSSSNPQPSLSETPSQSVTQA